MPTPPKFPAPRLKAGRGAKAATRSVAADIRRATNETLDAFPVARKAEARSLRDGPKQDAKEHREAVKAMKAGFRKTREIDVSWNDTERRRTVDRMMDGFSHLREDTARETVAKLQHNMQVLHRSVIEAKRDADARMKKIAAKRKAFAPVQARMLAKIHDAASKTQAKPTRGMTEAREQPTSDGKQAAQGVRLNTQGSRKSTRSGTGNGQARPATAAASKAAAPTKKASAANAKSAANGKSPAKRPAAAKPTMAAKKPATAAKAKPAATVKSAAKPAKPAVTKAAKPAKTAVAKVAKPAKPAVAKMVAVKSAPAKFKVRPPKG